MKLTKSKIIGLVAMVSALAIILAGLIIRDRINESTPRPVATETVDGYLGGEKTGLFDDARFKELAADNGLDVNYRKAGSLDMMTASHDGMDYLFPSAKTAIEWGKQHKVDVSKADVVFNSPIVIYTHKAVADALIQGGYMSRNGDVYQLDMDKTVDAMANNKTWADMGYPSAYGQFRIDSTDPVKSNSGNMYAALVAGVLNGKQPATADSIRRDQTKLRTIFAKSGWMEGSSEDSFNQFLTLGVGSKPMMVGYESQILDLAVNKPDAYKQVKDDLVVAYPTPTVWSTHMLVPLDQKGERLLALLKSKDMQKLAWERHGFRSATLMGTDPIKRFGVPGTIDQIPSATELPDADGMTTLINILSNQQQ